ncbi:hypothetical protein Hte_004298 [Hypoxylon texense]
MCQQWEMVLHCYECQKEYYRGPQRMPCADVDGGKPCRELVGGGQVLTNSETCNRCQEMRKAEEICQQKIYRMKPLYYNLEKKRAIYESYWNRQYTLLKREDKKVIKKAEEEYKERKKVEALKENSTQHQPSHFTTNADAGNTLPLR